MCKRQEVLYTEDFEAGVVEGWDLEPGWRVEQEEGNLVLSGERHSWARLQGGWDWTDYTFRFPLKLIRGGIHLNYRVGDEGRYFVGFREDGLYLNKEAPWGKFFELARSDVRIDLNDWHDIEIVGKGKHLKIYVDEKLEIDFTDANPLLQGSIAFETLESSHACIDNVEITSAFPPPDRPSPPVTSYPVVKVTKSLSPLGPDKKGIDILESATVNIKIEGDSIQNPKGLDVVLVLDESGSMKKLSKYSRSAAKNVVSLLNPSVKVALVTFSTKAQIVVPLTTQHKKVNSAIDKLPSPVGKTNVKEAFDFANSMLNKDKTAIKKTVFLFTDGMPTPITQADLIRKEIPFLNANNINYFTAGYGNFTKTWLMELAEDTGGQFCDPKTPDYIKKCFEDFWKEASKFAHAQQVMINEVLSGHFKVKHGSLKYSSSLKTQPKYLEDAMKTAAKKFYSTGILKTPPIYELPAGKTFHISFDVIAKTCKPKLVKLPVNDINKTYLKYKYGGKSFNIKHPQFNQVYIPVNACGVYVDKKFEMVNRIITIEIRNTFQDRNINDIHVVEILGKHVSPNTGAATPFKYGTLGQVAWPHYPPGSTWETDGMEWRFFDGIPASAPQKYPPHSWKITSHGYIKPNTKLTLSLPVIAKASAKGKSPVTINKEMILDPDNTQKGASISFWYKYEFGEPHKKSEQVGKYKYKYTYENLPGTGKWGSKRHVIIYLPKYEVLALPPK